MNTVTTFLTQLSNQTIGRPTEFAMEAASAAVVYRVLDMTPLPNQLMNATSMLGLSPANSMALNAGVVYSSVGAIQKSLAASMMPGRR